MCAKHRTSAKALFAHAEEEGMCVTPSTASERQAMRRAIKCGKALEPAAGVYARASYWLELKPEDKAWHKVRALAALHPDWVFAGPTAGLIHGLSVGYQDLDRIYAATSRKTHARPSRGITRIVVSGDTPVTRDQLKVTSFMRTVYDCMRNASFGQALAVADSAVRAKNIEAERLVHNLHLACGKRSNVGRVLDIARLADGRSESGGESIARAAMMHIGVPLPELQVEIGDAVDGASSYRVDFEWTLANGTKVYGELDGKEKYVNPEMTKGRDMADVLLDERRREAHITVGDKPVRVMRVSLREVMDVKGFERILAQYGILPVREPVGVMTEWP